MKKRIYLSLFLGLVCAVLLSFAGFDAKCETVRDGVLRLHVIANSDSDADQCVKLKVRDAVLKAGEEVFSNCSDIEEAKAGAEALSTLLEETAEEVLMENGFDYGAEVKIGKAFFETRVYDNFTLPAGNYEAVNITLGEGKGKNWWCVMFPSLCIGTADADKLTETLGKSAAEITENPQKYEIRFKTIEVYEDLKKIICKK